MRSNFQHFFLQIFWNLLLNFGCDICSTICYACAGFIEWIDGAIYHNVVCLWF